MCGLAAPPLRRIASALTLLTLLVAGVAEAVAHADGGLHAQRLAAQQELTSGCSRQHAPSLEARISVREIGCPACLLQIQERGSTPAATAHPAAPVVTAARVACAPAARLDRPCLHAAPRGPPLVG
jgi:hypothetical protein